MFPKHFLHGVYSIVLACALFSKVAEAQTFTGTLLATGSSTSNLFSVLAHSSTGDTYAFWKIQASASGVHYIVKWNGSGWTQLASFSPSDMLTGSVGTQDDVALAVDGAGALHLAARIYGAAADATSAPRVIIYGYSANGTNWTFTQVYATPANNSSYNTREPYIAVDSNNRPHILFRSNDPTGHVLRYYTYNGSSWSGSAIHSSGSSTYEINAFAFGLDSADHAHVIMVAESTSGTDGSPFYLTNASGSWSSASKIFNDASSPNIPKVSVAIDASDKVHFLYQNGARAIYYYNNSGGSFSGSQVNGSLTGAIMRHSFARNASGHMFFSYNPGTSNSGIAGYAYRLNGQSTWTTGTAFTNASDTANTMTLSFPVDLRNDHVATMLFNTSTNPRLLYYARAAIASSNTSPAFVGATTTLNVGQNASATDIKSLVHVSDSDSGQTLTWSQSSAPSHGTLAFSSATASSGGSDITPGGTITYTPASGYAGSDNFTVQVSDGTASATRTISVTVADTTKPTVLSVVRQSPSGANLAADASSVTFRVTYSEALSATPAAARYAIENVNGGTVTGTIGTPTAVGTGVYDVTVTITGGTGEFRLKVID